MDQSIQSIFKGRANQPEIPQAVNDAIKRKFGQGTPDYLRALQCLRYDHLNRCWCLGWAGMYLGIENDGHMHT